MFITCDCNMEKRYVTLVAVFVLASIQISCNEANEIADSTNAFALEIYRKLTKKSENLFFSPISITLAVAMTSLGAKGNTLNEIMTGLKMNKFENNNVHEWFSELKNDLQVAAKKNYDLSLVNNMFKQKGDKYLESFLSRTRKYYHADIDLLDFKTKWEQSRKHINDKVSELTNNKINNLLPPGIINKYTRLVLTSAIYFKGDWVQKFAPSKTHPSTFSVSDGKKVSVSMMHDSLKVKYRYSTALKSQVLEMPYKGETLSMVIILPRLEKTTLEEVERSLTPSILSNFDTPYKIKVDIFLPKFKLKSSFNLEETLKELGMRDMFKPNGADFSGIDGQKKTYVSKLVHKAVIKVDEHGSMAAAATASINSLRKSLAFKIIFKADHPFIFFIRDNASKTILFLGRLDRPTK